MHPQTPATDFRTLAIDQLRESPTNPRRTFDPNKLQELASSIRSQGVLVPLIVREIQSELFEVIAGARRFRAAQLAELFSLPVRVVELTDAEALELQLIENAIREDVHPYEEAMAYKALLETAQPRYEVATIALKTGRSPNHIYGRLHMAELIPDVAEVFQANQITAGHAVLIARLPQEQQHEALKAAFRDDWRSKEKYLISVRELSQWIRDNLMLTLADAVFDREDAELVLAAGPCITCSKRTGANTAPFDDFVPQDDRCLDAACFQSKIDRHIVRQKESIEGLVQITRAYHSNIKSEEPVLTRNDYTVIEPSSNQESQTERPPCVKATSAVVVDGPGKRGEIVQICADPECEVHGQPDRPAEREAEQQAMREERERQERARSKVREHNRKLLDAVLDNLPNTLTRDDYEMILLAAIDRLDFDDWEAIIERYKIDVDESCEPDAPTVEMRKHAQSASLPKLIRMLVEVSLIPSGYSDSELPATDPLVQAAARYKVPPASKPVAKSKRTKCAPKASKSPKRSTKAVTPEEKPTRKAARKGGAA